MRAFHRGHAMSSELDRPLVLVVEDDQDTREMYAMYLELSGIAVLTATNADSAFDLALTRQPRMVVSDYRLAGVATGADLCRRLQDDARTAGIPTLLLTGSARQHESDTLDAGCAQIRLKPYLPDALLNDIRETLSRAGGQPVTG